MPGIPLLNLGALPPLASPAAGIHQPNMIEQLGQEANQVPVEMQKLADAKSQTALRQEQIDALQRNVVQQRYDRNLQLAKNNPMLAKNAGLVSAIAADAKTLGVVAPITPAKNVVGPSSTAIGAGAATASPAGGAAPAGASPSTAGQVQDDGYFGAAPGGAMTLPNVTGGPNATPGGVPANLPNASADDGPSGVINFNRGEPSTLEPMTTTESGGPQLDMEAIAPHPSYSGFATPQNLKEAFMLTPAQRRAAYPPAMFAPTDQPPESFYSAPKTWGPDDNAHEITARMMSQQLIKSGDPKSVTSAINFLSSEFKDDPTKDIAAMLPPGTFDDINKTQRDRLEIQRRAGIISEKTLDLRTKKIDADMQLGQTRARLIGYQAEQKRIQNIYLPQELQQRLDTARTNLQNATKNANTRASELTERIKNDKIVNAGRDKADAIRIRGQLQTNINSLRSQANSLTANGQDQTATTDEQGNPSTLGAEIGKKIIEAEAARDNLKGVEVQLGSPKITERKITSAIPGATGSRPAGVPASAQSVDANGHAYTFQGKNAYVDPTTHIVYDAASGQVLYKP